MCVKLLGPALGCLLLAAGCGGSDETSGASKLTGELRNSRLGYSVRLPEDWRGAKGTQQNDVRAIQGPGGRECIVVPVLGLPDWSTEDGRRGYYETVARERRLDVRSTDAVQGANAEGITAVTASGPKDKLRLVRSSTFASGGVGVTVSCSAPESGFEDADRDVFRPMASSVSIRRNEVAEKLQPKLTEIDGVTAAGVLLSKEGANTQMRLASREAGVPAVKRALALLVSELDSPKVGVQAMKDPANPVIGNWDARTQRAFVQAVPNRPERYELRR
jgi:hypothetical protein